MNTININGEEYVAKKDLDNQVPEPVLPVIGTPYVKGEKYLIRTVTMIYTGRLKEVYDKELALIECAWIADTGRWKDAVELGSFSEVEPYPIDAIVAINREAILDATIVSFNLPKTQK